MLHSVFAAARCPMIRNIGVGIVMAVAGLFSSAHAQDALTVKDLASGGGTKDVFQKMVGSKILPNWVYKGGVDSPVEDIDMHGRRYFVFVSCKPHQCASESIAVLFTPGSKEMIGAFLVSDGDKLEQRILWLTSSVEPSIEEKMVLFAALTGSLENDQEHLNLK